uniref:Uncharacterized protein n=1 Tax=Physcomitrium patens TaxID=3218 RepID=A0A2K1J3J6_PHYPA|nr:hypothetical protein PHYPA_021941 [Physcomitrium patens]
MATKELDYKGIEKPHQHTKICLIDK